MTSGDPLTEPDDLAAVAGAPRHLRPTTGPEAPQERWWWRGSLKRSGTWRRGLVVAAIALVLAWAALLEGIVWSWRVAAESGLSWSLWTAAVGGSGSSIAWRALCALVVTAGWVAYLMLPVRDDD